MMQGKIRYFLGRPTAVSKIPTMFNLHCVHLKYSSEFLVNSVIAHTYGKFYRFLSLLLFG